jgi:hypothetical protein
MLKLLGPELGKHQKEIAESSFSVLYSDIGKKYYAGLGWKVFPSSHVSISSIEPTTTNGNGTGLEATPLTEQDFPSLLEQDLNLLTSQVKSTALSTKKSAFAIVPDIETVEWHHLRQSFMTTKLYPSRSIPTINGAISSGAIGSRIWIIFSRGYKDKMYILRLVVEDERVTDENAQKLTAVLRIAQMEAREWELKSVAVWNVSEVVTALLGKTGLEYKVEERKEESIPSMMWYGEGNGGPEEVEWVANEKFAWC